MNPVKLYVHPMSSNARRAHMTALMLGLQPEVFVVDLARGQQQAPEFLALNPNAKVPALVDGQVVLWESLAIMTYLAQSTPGQTLYPSALTERIHVDKWLFWAASHWTSSIAQLNFERFLKRLFELGDADPYTVERHETLLRQHAAVLDATLASAPYVAGDTLTLADVALAAPLMYADVAKLPLADAPHVRAWFSRMQELEAWKLTEPSPLGA